MTAPALHAAVEQQPLIDHHVHGGLRTAPALGDFVSMINEADTEPMPAHWSSFDSQLGFAIRAHCAPVLDLPRHASAADYWSRRTELGETEVNRRFLTGAGVAQWWIDTGFSAGALLDLPQMGRASGSLVREVVRLEQLIEELATADTASSEFADAFRGLLDQRTANAVGVKTILAYRCGFDVDLSCPSDSSVEQTYAAWRGSQEPGRPARVADPVLIAFAIHEAVERGLPVQFHVGLGDRDMDLRRSDPLLLTDFLRLPEVRRSSILLLHCYPFERQAGYLAQGFKNVYMDVGLGMNYLGARAAGVLARALELVPFDKLLYSSDAFGPAELHYLGARLWRDGLSTILGGFVADDEWSLDDAIRVVRMTSHDNALTAYARTSGSERPNDER